MTEWIEVVTKSDNVPGYTPIKGKITVMLAHLAPDQNPQVIVEDWARRHGEVYDPITGDTKNHTVHIGG